MFKVILTILLISISINGYSQYEEKLTKKQFYEVCASFKGYTYSFVEYYLNGIPCSGCYGGFISVNNSDNLEASYGCKGAKFLGTLKYPKLNYNPSQKVIEITCNWYNSDKTKGFSEAIVQFKFFIDKERGPNCIFKFQAGNIEMAGWYTLKSHEIENVSEFLHNSTQFGKSKKDDEHEAKLKKNKEDSIKLVKKKYEDSINLSNQRLLELVEKRRIEALEILKTNLRVGDEFENGIVVFKDIDGKHGILMSKKEIRITLSGLNKVINENKDYPILPVKPNEDLLQRTEFPEYTGYKLPNLTQIIKMREAFSESTFFKQRGANSPSDDKKRLLVLWIVNYNGKLAYMLPFSKEKTFKSLLKKPLFLPVAYKHWDTNNGDIFYIRLFKNF